MKHLQSVLYRDAVVADHFIYITRGKRRACNSPWAKPVSAAELKNWNMPSAQCLGHRHTGRRTAKLQSVCHWSSYVPFLLKEKKKHLSPPSLWAIIKTAFSIVGALQGLPRSPRLWHIQRHLFTRVSDTIQSCKDHCTGKYQKLPDNLSEGKAK